MYFIPCIIKLQPEYQHLAKQFASTINITHHQHNTSTTDYPHLSRYIHQNQHHPPPRLLFALIITISPKLKICNQLLIQTPIPDWTTLLLGKMALLQNPPERHITTPHPYTQFKNINQDIIKSPNCMYIEFYDFIKQTEEPPNLQIMKDKFPYLPENLLIETLKCNDTLEEYSHPLPLPNMPPIHRTRTYIYNQF